MTMANWLARELVWTLAICGVLALQIYFQDAKPSPIRVNTTLVVVRAEVFDKKHMSSLSKEERECLRADQRRFYGLSLTRPYIPKACWGLVVRDLKASDFHLFVEGVEQKIQGFYPERSNLLVRDNFGAHNEFSFTPAAKWSSADMPLPSVGSVQVDEAENFHYFYNLAFAPDTGAGASCRNIKLKVDRSQTLVYYRPEYCVQQTPFDLLGGTSFGKLLEQQAESANPGLALSYQIGRFYVGNEKSRVWLSIEFPGNLFRRNWVWSFNEFWSLQGSIGVFGIVRNHDGTEVMRFSDLGCCSDYSTARLFTTLRVWGDSLVSSLQIAPSKQMLEIERARVPIRYEAQFELPPGDYELRLALSDGARVGRIQTELRIENPTEGLGLSSIMLGKRVQDARVAAEEMAAAENFAPQYVPLVSQGVQVAPAGNTHFKEYEQMLAYFEVYESKLVSASSTAQTHLRICDATTREIKRDLRDVDAAPYVNPGRATIPILVRIPLNTLAKGWYQLEVQATDSSGQSTPWRSAPFTVE